MSAEFLHRTLTPKTRVLDEARGLVEYIASDESLDSYREIIRAAGWLFDERFKSNPVFVDSHSYWGIRDVLGRVVEWKVKGSQLIEVVQWAIDVEENALARLGFAMTAKGYLKAVSVGFMPSRMVRRDADDFTVVADEMGLTGDARDKVRVIYYEQQQIELSACVIGANPSALAKAFGDRGISRDLFNGVGLGGDEGAEFIELAGAAYDANPDDAVRKLVTMQLRQFAGSRLSASRAKSGPASSHSGAGSAGGGQRQRSRDARAWLKRAADALGD